MEKLILDFAMYRSKKYFCDKYSEEWFVKFKKLSRRYLNKIYPKIPDIGESLFAMNYKFAPVYIAWYKAFQKLQIAPEEIDKEIWILNENMMSVFPGFILKAIGKIYLGGFRKKAKKHIKIQNRGMLHPYDWKIKFREIDNNTFEIDVMECAYKKLAKYFQVEKMLPGVCRMDYLMANLMGNGFRRTKTLGDGDECCNCIYAQVGKCEWSPEKGFIDRK